MNENERYHRISKPKAEFIRLFKGQEPVFLKTETAEDGEDVRVFIYPTGGVCVKQCGHCLFYNPDLHLICCDHIYRYLSYYRHYRYLFRGDRYGGGDIIWYAERNKSEAVVYVPKRYRENKQKGNI